MVQVTGIMPPGMACRIRKTTISVMPVEIPHSAEKTVNSAIDQTYSFFWPIRLPSHALTGTTAPSVRPYAVEIHWADSAVAPKSLRMLGSAMLTMLVSRMDMNIPMTSTMSGSSQLGPPAGAGAGAAGTGAFGTGATGGGCVGGTGGGAGGAAGGTGGAGVCGAGATGRSGRSGAVGISSRAGPAIRSSVVPGASPCPSGTAPEPGRSFADRVMAVLLPLEVARSLP